jgi:hypothetical protein
MTEGRKITKGNDERSKKQRSRGTEERSKKVRIRRVHQWIGMIRKRKNVLEEVEGGGRIRRNGKGENRH